MIPAEKIYDAIIVGAGPAGAFSAYLLASRGWSTLLVEKSPWPRDKPCGGCLNAAALQLLHNANLSHVLSPSTPLTHMSIRLQSDVLDIPLPEGRAIHRQEFDRRLVNAAIAQGTTFQPHTTATLLPENPPLMMHESPPVVQASPLVVQASRLPSQDEPTQVAHPTPTPFRTLQLTHQNHTSTANARIVLACDGLRGTLLAHEPWATFHTAHPTRLGFSTTLPAPSTLEIPEHTLLMAIAPAGYLGLVRLADNRLHLGAALNPAPCNALHGPAPVIQQILAANRLPAIPLAHLIGTGPLTRHRTTLAAHRVLAIGDACGYVEPFTGEGIAWALRAALEATQLLHSPNLWPASLPIAWQRRYDAHVRRRQIWCRQLRLILHRPRLAAACMTVAHLFPRIPQSLARRISA